MNEIESQHQQVGGDHYDNKGVFAHHIFVVEHDINWHLSNAIKYLLRHHRKNGKQDLDKAADYCRMYAEVLETFPKLSETYRKPVGLETKVMRDFCRSNSAPPLEGGLIETLAILNHMSSGPHVIKFYRSFADHIDELCRQRYPIS